MLFSDWESRRTSFGRRRGRIGREHTELPDIPGWYVNGGLLSPEAQAELDSSFVPTPDFDSPFVTTQAGFALTKLIVTGIRGFPDSQIIWHGGSPPGVECMNAVAREHDSNRTLAVGSMCQNGHGPGNPSLTSLWLDFLREIIETDSGATFRVSR